MWAQNFYILFHTGNLIKPGSKLRLKIWKLKEIHISRYGTRIKSRFYRVESHLSLKIQLGLISNLEIKF